MEPIEEYLKRVWAPTEILKITRISFNSFNDVFKVDTRSKSFIVKRPKAYTIDELTILDNNTCENEFLAYSIIKDRYPSLNVLCHSVQQLDNGNSLALDFIHTKRPTANHNRADLEYYLTDYLNLQHSITNCHYGTLDGKIAELKWHDFFSLMFTNIITSLCKRGMLEGETYERVMRYFENSQESLKHCSFSSLVHNDITHSNILLGENNNLILVDYERSLWGDCLMDIAIAKYNRLGINKDGLSMNQQRRIHLYIVFHICRMSLIKLIRNKENTFDYQTFLIKYLNKVS